MDRRRAAGALLALAACIACSTAAPTASNQTALELLEGPSEGCYYNFQHYGEGDRIMTNEPCLNCTCHNRMLMCYLKVCPFTKPIGQDCTIEKRADQCCPIVTCPDVPVDLLTSTSTSSPAEYGATGLGKVDKYGCSINGKYFPEGSKVPPAPNKPCEHCYCIRNMTTCVMQECTLHVDGCTPIYHKDVCCPVRYSCDHLEDEMLLLDDMTTTVRPTPGFLLTTTTMPSVTQVSQNCIHDDQIVADGALIKTEIACEHCYCMKGDIVCVVQECGTPMENEGKNCTSLPPRQGQCCPDTYICEGDELSTDLPTTAPYEELTTLPPPRRVEGSGYRNEPDEPYTEIPTFEGSGEEHATTLDSTDLLTTQKQTPQVVDETFAATEETYKPSLTTIEPDKGQNTVPDDSVESTSDSQLLGKTTLAQEAATTALPTVVDSMKETDVLQSKTTISDYYPSSEADSFISKDDEFIITTEPSMYYTNAGSHKFTENKPDISPETTESFNIIEEVTTEQSYLAPSSSDASTVYKQEEMTTTLRSTDISKNDEISEPKPTTPEISTGDTEDDLHSKDKPDISLTHDKEENVPIGTTTDSKNELSETTSINPIENEIDEDVIPPGRIPGEGDCLLNGVTYKNNTNVPNINNCHSSCKCISSIVKCDPIICSPPPEHMDNMNDCQPIYDTPDACCPTYVCHSRETIPPESHSQMSGTESPKPSHENECNNELCQPHETKPISDEHCDSANCKSEMKDKEKECVNGECDHTQTSIDTLPTLTNPEACLDGTCQPSVETCTDGKCQQPVTGEAICNSDKGCQPSEECEGNNCAAESIDIIPKDDVTHCKDSEECKITDSKIPNENTVPLECTEESCRRKEKPQEESKQPSECSGPSCIAQGVEEELNTESVINEIEKESTTEMIGESYPKLPDSGEIPTIETQKVPQVEVTTEHKETPPELTSDKYDETPAQELSETVSQSIEPYTSTSESYVTKIEETDTEIYNKPETEEDSHITISDTHTDKYQDQVTESMESITKETSTESKLATQYEEQPTDSGAEEISGTPVIVTEPSPSSSEILDIEPHDHDTSKNEMTDANITEEITITPSHTQTTTSEFVENDLTEQEYTDKHDKYTESPLYSTPSEKETPHITEKQEESKIVTHDSVSTESKPDISITETSVTISPEISSDKPIDVQITEEEVTEIYDKVSNVPAQFTTEQSIQVEQSSITSETKLDETATSKVDEKVETDSISTEKPHILTEPTETTEHKVHKVEEAETPQTTIMEAFPVDADTSKESTVSPITAQDNLSDTVGPYDTVTEKQDIYTTPRETEGHIGTDSSIIYTTQPSELVDSQDHQTHEIPIAQKDETLPEHSIKESTTSQEFDMQEISTIEPEMLVTNIKEITTETIGTNNISFETMSDKFEEHSDTPIKGVTKGSTNVPEETLEDNTTHKDTSFVEPQDNGITTHDMQIDDLQQSTVPSILPHISQESSTKYEETEMESSEQTTVIPELHLTKSPKPVSLPADSETNAFETSTSSQVDGIEKETGLLQTNIPTQESFIDESSLVPTTPYVEGHSPLDDESIPVSIDESKTEEKPSYTTPETMMQNVEKEYTVATVDHVTEGIENDISEPTVKDTYRPTEHTILNTMEPQDIATHASGTELQSKLDITTSVSHVIQEEKGETESPMSLVTEISEPHSEMGIQDSAIDKMTQAPNSNVNDEEKSRPQITVTESSELPESEIKLDSEDASPTYPKKESQPEISFTSELPEYTTVKNLDVQDKEKSPLTTDNTYINDISTELIEKLSPVSETTVTQNPIKTDSELYVTDSLHESTSVAPGISSSEQSFVSEEKLSTRYSESSDDVTTVSYDHGEQTNPETTPIKEQSFEKDTEQNNLDFTTPVSTITENLKEDHEDSQQENKVTVMVQEDEHTVSPDLQTSNYPVISDEIQEKPSDEHKLSEQEEHTLSPDQHISATEEYSTKQTISPHIDTQTSLGQEQEKSTEIIYTSNEKDVTTPKELLTDILESHLSTVDILSMESSTNLPDDEYNRRTVSPSLQPEEHTTEKQEITELQETTKTQEVEQTGTTQKISLNIPERDGVTLDSMNEEFDHVTSIPQVTEGDIKLQTETLSSNEDQEITVATEHINIPSVEVQDVTLQPDIDISVNENLHTVLPELSVTEKDELISETTAHDDLAKITVSLPQDHSIAQETQTQTIVPKETEINEPTNTEISVPQETESEISVPIVTEITIPKATEPSIIKENEIEASTPKEPNVTETPKLEVPENTEPSVYEVTETLEHEMTKSPKPEDSGTSTLELTESPVAEVTKLPSPDITKDLLSDVTEISAAEATESSVTVGTVSKVSDTSIPKETESEIIYTEPESTTYIPKYEESEAPVQHLATLEQGLSSSETTPYLVELQEHTTKADEEVISVTPTTEDKTKAPETYQTERGDQPLDSFPDKTTQEDSTKEHTTKETFTQKEEQLTTLPPGQANEYPYESPDKTEIAPEDALTSSESPSITLLDTQIGQHTVTSGEQSMTISPSATFANSEKVTTPGFAVETTTDNKNLPLDTEKPSEHEIMHETTSSENILMPAITKATTTITADEITTHPPVVDDKFKPEDKPSESYSPTVAPELPKPGLNEIQATEEVSPPDFPPSGSTGYGQEPDYVEEDQAFGPGTCRYGGKVYVSAQQIPRDDPCDFCFCFRSDIICLQQSCPPPIHGCHEEPIQGFCCPRYECPVSMATTLNVTTTTTTTTTTLPPHFLPHAYKGAAQRRGCQIKGHSYKVGEVVRASSGPCLHCTCGGDGQMKCDPKACTPEPMLRQMIAAAVSAKRRR